MDENQEQVDAQPAEFPEEPVGSESELVDDMDDEADDAAAANTDR